MTDDEVLEEAGSTADDFHRRRDGEPIGFVPAVGDSIRYAMRHLGWSTAAKRWIDGHDEQGDWGAVTTVTGIYTDDYGYTRYACKDARGGRSSIDLEWWICEQHVEAGALF